MAWQVAHAANALALMALDAQEMVANARGALARAEAQAAELASSAAKA